MKAYNKKRKPKHTVKKLKYSIYKEPLKSKKVRYVPRLWDLWVTEQEFNALFQNWLPTFEVEKPLVSNNEENGKTDWWEQDNSWNIGKTKKK